MGQWHWGMGGGNIVTGIHHSHEALLLLLCHIPSFMPLSFWAPIPSCSLQPSPSCSLYSSHPEPAPRHAPPAGRGGMDTGLCILVLGYSLPCFTWVLSLLIPLSSPSFNLPGSLPP